MSNWCPRLRCWTRRDEATTRCAPAAYRRRGGLLLSSGPRSVTVGRTLNPFVEGSTPSGLTAGIIDEKGALAAPFSFGPARDQPVRATGTRSRSGPPAIGG